MIFRSGKLTIITMIMELEIIIISIKKSNILREKLRESISKLSNQDIYIKLNKIIEKFNK